MGHASFGACARGCITGRAEVNGARLRRRPAAARAGRSSSVAARSRRTMTMLVRPAPPRRRCAPRTPRPRRCRPRHRGTGLAAREPRGVRQVAARPVETDLGEGQPRLQRALGRPSPPLGRAGAEICAVEREAQAAAAATQRGRDGGRTSDASPCPDPSSWSFCHPPAVCRRSRFRSTAARFRASRGRSAPPISSACRCSAKRSVMPAM
jgi:hypothetical protein